MRGDMQAGRREGVGRRRRKQRAGRAESLRLLAGTRGAHWKHAVHVFDAGRVEAQWLVEHRRLLPRPNGSIGRGVTCWPGGGRAWGGGGANSVHGGPNCGGCWQGHARSAL